MRCLDSAGAGCLPWHRCFGHRGATGIVCIARICHNLHDNEEHFHSCCWEKIAHIRSPQEDWESRMNKCSKNIISFKFSKSNKSEIHFFFSTVMRWSQRTSVNCDLATSHVQLYFPHNKEGITAIHRISLLSGHRGRMHLWQQIMCAVNWNFCNLFVGEIN